MRLSRPAVGACAGLVWMLVGARAGDAAGAQVASPDAFLARVEALALLQTLNADLLSHDSATLTLERWCAAHALAAPPRIIAERVSGSDLPPTPEQRADLGVAPTETIRHRRVRLRCGTVVLSEADNWYVPGRLTPAMNAQLDGSDAPFGKVVQALQFRRHTLSSTLLWSPLPEGWEMNPAAARDGDGAAPMRIPEHLLQHKAVLLLPDGTPFSEVVETYTGNVLGFPIPKP
jgi:hypothetical protein